jgi:hypothetical protein
MIKNLSKYFFWGIVLVVFISFMGCVKKQSSPKSEPVIKKVLVDSDLSLALGINLVKYEYDLKSLEVPVGKLVNLKVWMELLQEDKKIREWSTPNIICHGDSGSILLASYKPPLFKNDQETVQGKIIVDAEALFGTNISLDMPFRIQAHSGGFNQKTIEMDKEYTLAEIVEIYSPRGKGVFSPSKNTDRNESENKALILKVKFGLIEE